jgi:hypothetical protein
VQQRQRFISCHSSSPGSGQSIESSKTRKSENAKGDREWNGQDYKEAMKSGDAASSFPGFLASL